MRSSSSRTASGSANGTSRTSVRAGPRHRPSASSKRCCCRGRFISQALVSRTLLERRESADVGLFGCDREPVAGRNSLDQLSFTDLAERRAHPVDVDTERGQWLPRGMLSP